MKLYEPDEAALERGRLLFARRCDFVLGAASLSQLPAPDRLEVCFAGRSNVGKSSLLNALTGRKNLARASNTPGRTQQLNYFDLDGQAYLVDLPGYGYAEAPLGEVRKWQDVLKAYLRGRASLRRVYVLVDSRHGVKKVDHEIMTLLDKAAVSFQVVLTKADKPKKGGVEQVLASLEADLKQHPTAYPEVIVTSSETGDGVADLRAAIVSIDG